jgi:uncharacterized protein YhhL (DUF1145 family)
MSVVAFAIEVAKLAIMAIILFYVVEMITAMPVNMRRVVQALIIFIAIMATLQMVLADAPPGLARRSWDPLLGSTPSIMAPERK